LGKFPFLWNVRYIKQPLHSGVLIVIFFSWIRLVIQNLWKLLWK